MSLLSNATAAKKSVSFAERLRQLSGKVAVTLKGKGGKVEPATAVIVGAEIPELTKGLYYTEVIDGKTYYRGHTNDRGVTACVFHDELGIGGVKGAVYVGRNHIVLTPAIAAYILRDLKGHNRNVTAPAVKRYKEAMLKSNSDPTGWHFVGNTLGFVVKKAGDDTTIGQCNGGHGCHAAVESGKTILINAYFGVPEVYANLADVNIPRTPKDTIGRLHHFDQYKDMTELDGEPLPVTITAADVKSMDNVQSQALRILACVQAGKKVKDSEPLGPGAIAQLDTLFGTILKRCVLKVYLIDRAATSPNAKGKAVPGALKRRIALSHAAACMALLATERDESNKLVLNPEAMEQTEGFYYDLVDEAQDDQDVPAVALRDCLDSFKTNRMTNQNIRFTCLKIALAAHFGGDVAADVDSLEGVTEDESLCFQTELDPLKEEPEGGKELADDEE